MSDLIRRQDAFEELKKEYNRKGAESGWELGFGLRLAWIEKAINSVPAVQQWIPCSEKLPNSNGCYLVWRPHFFGGEIGMPSICYFDGQNTWHDSYGVDFGRVLSSDDITAWMPLPDPWEGDPS